MEADRFFTSNFPASMISFRASIEVYDSLFAVNVPLFFLSLNYSYLQHSIGLAAPFTLLGAASSKVPNFVLTTLE